MSLVIIYCTLFQIGGLAFEQFTAQLKSMPVAQRSVAVRQYIDVQPTTPIIEQDSIVSLYWLGNARAVAVNGDFQRGWSRPDTMEAIPCGTDTFFIKTYIIPLDARLDYQFIINGQSTTDPRNPRITPSGYGPHSEIAMPKFRSTSIFKSHLDISHRTFDTLMFTSSDSTIRARQVIVYKPAGYQNLSELPSLYVHDGFEALKFSSIAAVLDNLIAEKKIPPILAVFIPPIERDFEYLWLKYRKYRTALCDELVPMIDRMYKTSRQPQKRAMMGISNGGHISLITALKRPDVFLSAAGQSSTITDQLFEVLDYAAEDKNVCGSFRLYLDVGRYDLENDPSLDLTFLKTNRLFHHELERYGIKHIYHEFNDGHEWANWRERTEEIVRYFFQSH